MFLEEFTLKIIIVTFWAPHADTHPLLKGQPLAGLETPKLKRLGGTVISTVTGPGGGSRQFKS
jgi:hypothetical protein